MNWDETNKALELTGSQYRVPQQGGYEGAALRSNPYDAPQQSSAGASSGGGGGIAGMLGGVLGGGGGGQQTMQAAPTGNGNLDAQNSAQAAREQDTKKDTNTIMSIFGKIFGM